MAQFHAETARMQDAAAYIKVQAAQLSRCEGKIKKLSKDAHGLGRAYAPIASRLRAAGTKAADGECALNRMQQALGDIVALYRSAEAFLLQRHTAGGQENPDAVCDAFEVPAFYFGDSAGLLFGQYTYRVRFIENLGLYPLLYGVREHYNIVKNALMSLLTGRPYVVELGREETRKMLAKIINRLNGNEYPDYVKSEVELMMKQLKLGQLPPGMDESVFELFEMLSDSSEGVETFEKMLVDYTANIEMLNALKENSGISGESAGGVAINEMIEEYNNQFLSYVKNQTESLADDIAKGALDKLLGGQYKLVDSVIQSVLGGVEPIDCIDTIMATSSLAAPASQAYQTCVARLQSGNYTPADVQACRQSFEFCKALYVEEYQAMLDATPKNTVEATYLRSELNKLQNMQFEAPQTSQSFSSFEQQINTPLASGDGTGGGFSSPTESGPSGGSGGGGF